MKKTNLLILILISVNISILGQTIDHNQVLADLISTKKWFEVDQYYQKHKKNIDSEFVKLLYTAETSKVFNRPAQAFDAYEQLLDKNLLKMDTPTLISVIGQPLLQTCGDEQEYVKGALLCKKMINILQNDTAIDATSYIQGLTTIAETFNKWSTQILKPKIIDNKPNDNEIVQLISDKFNKGIYFNAKWNGVNLRTYFDTGASACLITNKSIAEKIGVKLNSTDTIMMNGNIKGLTGIVDSLTIGKFSIKDVTVFVNIENVDRKNPRQVMCDSAMNSMFDIVLGTPIIRQLGVIEFDFSQNTMSFPKNKKTLNQRNIYMSGGTLYMNMKICNTNFLTYFDTGGKEGLSINTDFYEKHKRQITVDSQATLTNGAVGGCNEASLYTRYEYKCPKIDIQINNQKLVLINNCTVAKDKESDNKYGTSEGGFLGNYIFSYCKKAVFDFNNMIFSIKK